MHGPTRGFTLIDLITAVVLLGILAAVALPKFSDFRKEARIAGLTAAAGQIRSAAEGARMQCLVHPPCSELDEYSSPITGPDGRQAKLKYGYPASVTTSQYFGIKEWISFSAEFLVLEFGIPSHRTEVRWADAPIPADCAVTYQTGSLTGVRGETPSITLRTTGC